MNRFDALDMDLDVMYNDVRVDEENLGFVEEEGEDEEEEDMVLLVLCRVLNFSIRRQRLRRQNERENVRKRRRPQHVGDYVEEEGYTRLQVRRIAGNNDSGLTFLGNVEHIPGTVMSQNFLRRFGLSRNDFENLVNLARQSRIEVEPGVFKSRFVDDLNGMRRRPKPIPLHHKIAATICSLRDGCSFKSFEPTHLISESVLDRFFHEFTKWVSTDLFEEHVFFPRTVEERNALMTIYGGKGLGLCIGSMDGTKIPCSKICHEARWMSTSPKTNGTSFTANFVWDPNGLVLSVSDLYYGATNDSVMADQDAFVTALREDPLFTETTTEIQDLQGNKYIDKGCWLLTDCGYSKEKIFMSPDKNARLVDTPLGFLSRFIESNRKDAECGFGALKQEFQMAKKGFNFGSAVKVQHAVRTMCVLHNIRGRANGWEKRGLEEDDFTQYTPTLQNYEMNVLDQLEIDRW